MPRQVAVAWIWADRGLIRQRRGFRRRTYKSYGGQVGVTGACRGIKPLPQEEVLFGISDGDLGEQPTRP